MVVLDTNIIIEHLRSKSGETSLSRIVEQYGVDSLAISIISMQELYTGKSTRSPNQEQNLLALISACKILPYTYEIAKKAGELERDSEIIMEFGDAAIAATALVNEYDLATLNTKHFRHIEGLALA
jgi:tRNA(fMet)-specific endonuclease VapC